MKGSLVIILLIAIAFTRKISKEDGFVDQSDISKRFSEINLSFDENGLEAKTKKTPFVVVLYNNIQTNKGRKLQKMFEKLQKAFLHHEISFLQIRADKSVEELYEIFIFINGVKKVYGEDKSLGSLKMALSDLYEASPSEYQKLSQIPSIESHYFVYVDKDYKIMNQETMNDLARLVHPIGIIYGLDDEELKIMTEDTIPDTKIWIYREYGKQIIPLDIGLTNKELANEISNNEFLPLYKLNAESLRFITELHNSTILYFTETPEEDFIADLNKVAVKYKDIFITIVIDMKDKSKETIFLKNFMKVNENQSLRILDMSHGADRFRYLGALDHDGINEFVEECLEGKAKSYMINERIEKGDNINGVKKINYRDLDKIINMSTKNHLVTVYSSSLNENEHVFEELGSLNAALSQNKNLKLALIDHDKNDIDEFLINNLPFSFLIKNNGRMFEFEGEVAYDGLLAFLKKKFPKLQVKDVQTGEDI